MPTIVHSQEVKKTFRSFFEGYDHLYPQNGHYYTTMDNYHIDPIKSLVNVLTFIPNLTLRSTVFWIKFVVDFITLIIFNSD